MTPWSIVGSIAAALAIAIGAYFYGVDVGRASERADQLETIEREIQAAETRGRTAGAKDARLASQAIAGQSIIRETIREVPTIVDRPVYRNICIDDGGVSLIRRAVDAANGQPAERRPAG